MLWGRSAVAQDQNQEASNELEEVIVTGTTGRGITALESSVGLTQISADDLERDAPFGLSETLKAVPGMYVQESGGASSNSVGVRGLPSTGHMRYISVQEDGLPVNYDQYTVDAVQRFSIGIERIEAIRGGTSGVLAPNGSGAIINYIYKKGTQDSEGTVRMSYADYDNIRTDFFYGGPLSDEWVMALSGYYTHGDSPRENGFTSEKGGEFRINLTREIENGEINFTYKKVDESNGFVLPLPVNRSLTSGEPSEINGFDLSDGNVNSFDNSRTRILFADGTALEQNLVDGFDVDAEVFTASLDLEFSEGLYFRHASRVSNLERLAQGHWTGSATDNSILPAASYLADTMDFGGGYGTVGEFYSANPGAKRCFQYVTSKELLCMGDDRLENLNGNGLNGNGLVQVLNALREPIEREQFISDTRLTWETDKNSLTVGVMFADLSHNRALATSFFLSEVTGSGAKVLDIVAVDSNDEVDAYLSDGGVVKHGHWRGDDDVQVQSISLYINDEFQVNEQLRIDAGLRFEDAEFKGASLGGLSDRVAVAGAFDEDGDDVDNIWANNYATRLKGNGATSRFEGSYDEVAWTIGFNYLLSDELAIYGRYAEGFQTPRADRLGDFRVTGSGATILRPVDEVELLELGVRFSRDTLAASATLYNTEFPTIFVGIGGVAADNTVILNEASLSALGIEFDVSWEPLDWLAFNAVGVWQEGELDDYDDPNLDGSTPERTPDEQFRLSATAYATDDLSLFMDWHWLGERYGSNDNQVVFEACSNLGLGAAYTFTDMLKVQLKGKNITDEVCYTEGNPRATVEENVLARGFARPIVGATWTLSVQLDF